MVVATEPWPGIGSAVVVTVVWIVETLACWLVVAVLSLPVFAMTSPPITATVAIAAATASIRASRRLSGLVLAASGAATGSKLPCAR